MKFYKNRDLKSYLLFSSRSILRILRISPKIFLLPSIIVYPSNLCNFRCIMCDEGADSAKTPQKFDIRSLEKLLTECASYRIKPKIHFSGLGEPLVYNEISAAMRFCGEKKIDWSMTTNGYLLETYAEDLVKNGCRAINVSIHGSEADHNKVAGVHNAFEKAVRGLQKMEAIKRTANSPTPLVAINCVITAGNLPNLKTILRDFITLPVNSITFQHLIFSQDDFRDQKPFVIREKEQVESLVQFMRSVENTPFPMKINFFPKIKIKDVPAYYSLENDKFNQSCVLPWLSVRISPNGDAEMCGVAYGNIMRSDLRSVINSDSALSFRRTLMNKKFRSPECFRCCHRHYY
jgi:MoaA/NifB/PqqE/SkfB family radical SAM enzyme